MFVLKVLTVNWQTDTDYICGRLLTFENTKELGSFMQQCFECVKQLPPSLVPCYFDIVVTKAYTHAIESVWSQMSPYDEYRQILSYILYVLCIRFEMLISVQVYTEWIVFCESISFGFSTMLWTQ